jgi:hypothetical protein
VGHLVVSTVATWAFFAMLLAALGATNSSIKAIGLTILIFIAMFSCPLMNPSLIHCKELPMKKKK